ncbi:MAG: bifunctional precorrin-2 dehydrogenase/sirohydrochlorin ferrochelatase [Candidatus Ornithomonoglobus sp.]
MGYMVDLNVKNRLCVIVGGGRGAYIKAKRLVNAGAHVRIIAENTDCKTDGLGAETVIKSYDKDDLNGAFAVFALTDDEELNRRIAEEARNSGALVCCGAEGDFEVAAAESGEHMRAAVTTGYPKLSAALIRDIMKYDELCGILCKYRGRVIAEVKDSAEKDRLLSWAVSEEMLSLGLEAPREFEEKLMREIT